MIVKYEPRLFIIPARTAESRFQIVNVCFKLDGCD